MDRNARVEFEQAAEAATFPVVGIGVSAEDEQALTAFFRHVPARPGMAFVVMVQPAPDQHDQLAQVVKAVSGLPVQLMSQPTRLSPDHVYVWTAATPPAFGNGAFLLAADNGVQASPTPLDQFFQSLAAAFGPQAIAVWLSPGSELALEGLKHIKQAGGRVYLHDSQKGAAHEDHPAFQLRIANGVLPAAEIASAIAARQQHSAPEPQPADAAPQPASPSTGATKKEGLSHSEEYLRLVIESAKDYAIITLDADRKVATWSRGAVLLFGYAEAEMIGQTGDIIFVPEDRAAGAPQAEAQTAVDKGRAENERWHLRKDGSRFWGSGITHPLYDEDRKPVGFVKLLQDLTESKRLEETKSFLASIVESSNDSIITIDFQRNITSWNKAAEQLYGYTAAEAIGRNLNMLTFPEDLADLLNKVEAVEHSRQVVVFDTVRHKKDGGLIDLEIVMSPVLNDAGKVIGVSTIARDVSERKRWERQLTTANERLRATFDNSHQIIQLFKAIRDEQTGDIVDFEWLMTNQRWNELYGDVIGKRLLTQNPAVIETGLFDEFKKVTETGVPVTQEHYYAHEQFDGWFSQTVAKVEDGFMLTTLEITERKRREANLAFLAEVDQDLVHINTVDETMQTLCKKIADYLDLSAVAFAEITKEERGIINHAWQRSGMPNFVGTYDMKEFVSAEVLDCCRTGKNVVIHDVHTDPRTDGDQYAALNIGSFLAIPLVRNGAWSFLLCVYRSGPSEWRTDEIETAREFATRSWDRLERARAEALLRQSEEKYRSLFEHIDEGFAVVEVVTDKQGNAVDIMYNEANQAFERHSGMHNFIGKKASDLFPKLEQHWLDMLTGVYQTGTSMRSENFTAELDRWLDVHYSRIGDTGSPLIAVVFNDITERKRFEIQLKESYEQIQLATKAAHAGWGYRNFITGEAYWDEQGKKILGFPNEEDSHTVEGWRKRVHPEDLPSVEALMAECIQDDKPFDLEYRVVRADGETCFVHAMGTFSKDEKGTLVKAGGLVMDITERKRQEQHQAFLLQFSDALRAEANPDAVAILALQLVFGHLQLDRCYIGTYLLAEDRADLTHQVGNERVPPMPDHVRLSDFPDAFQVVFDRTLVINDVSAEEGLTERDKQNMKALGFGGIAAATLRKGKNHPLWAMVAVSAIPRQWTPAEILLLEEVTERTWAALERAKAEEAVRKSEGQLRAMVENLPGGAVFIVDENLRYLLAEGEALFAAGFTPEDFVGKTLFEALPEDLARTYERRYRQGLAGEPFVAEHAAHNHVYLSRGVPLVNDEGKVYAVLAISYDITQRKKAEEALRKSEHQLRLIIESAKGFAIFTTDEHGIVNSWNPGAAEIFGWPEDEMLDRSADVLFTAEDRATGQPQLERDEAAREGIAPDNRWHLCKDGSLVFINGFTHPVYDSTGTLHGFVKIGRDMTAQYNTEQALREAEENYRTQLEREVEQRTAELKQINANLQYANENLQQFASIASHDLQEPLRKIKMFTSMLRLNWKDNLPQEGKEVMDKITASADRMSELIKDVLTYSRTAYGAREFQPTELQAVLQTVLDDLGLLIKETGASVECERPLPKIVAIPLHMHQLFYNLLTNAVKFSDRRKQPAITINWAEVLPEEAAKHPLLTANTAYIDVTVSDNGIGFDPEFAEQIFEIFERLHSVEEYAGTGVGLALCKKIAEAHRGHIYAVSQEGQGATFHVLLPVNH